MASGTLTPAQAARRLGVSVKTLRIYERRGLIAPPRTDAGWRVYRPTDLARAADIVALRALGLSLRDVACAIDGDADRRDAALAAHARRLEARLRETSAAAETIQRLRAELGPRAPTAAVPARGRRETRPPAAAFDLPWPWGGERFEIYGPPPLVYIVGPLGSGKTRLARRLADTLPNAVFLGLERLENGAATSERALQRDPAARARVEAASERLTRAGAAITAPLIALVAGLEADPTATKIVDMVEQGLDEATQTALIADLRARPAAAPPILTTTRSMAILDLDRVTPSEAVIHCPANHDPPYLITPYRGAPGYEAVASCLARPSVRARTDGVVAIRRAAPR